LDISAGLICGRCEVVFGVLICLQHFLIEKKGVNIVGQLHVTHHIWEQSCSFLGALSDQISIIIVGLLSVHNDFLAVVG